MSNRDVRATWEYHNATKHSEQSLRAGSHFLDWANQPIPYKIYSSLERIPLPGDFPPNTVSALDAIAASGQQITGERIPELSTLARVCFFSNGITKRWRLSSGEMFALRAAACTGALYHIELYLVCGDLPGLAAGIYHYGAHDNSLRQLRAADFRQVLVEATAAEPSIVEAPAVIICTSTFWRNAWKYQSRAYRHAYWDNGTILANLLAVAAASSLPAKVVLGFVDELVNQLLDVDPQHEAAISLVTLGRTTQLPAAAPPVLPLGLPTARLSPREVDYPAIWTMHAASSLASREEVMAWRSRPSLSPLPPAKGQLIPLQPLDPSKLAGDPIEDVIRRRGSTRRFIREPIAFEQLSTMLACSIRGIPADCLDLTSGPLSDLYLIVNAVDGLQQGAYILHREEQALELLKAGNFRNIAGRLALNQALGADASVNVYFLINLEPVLARFGNRGYRIAQLAAAIAAGKLYLAAYALSSGATGLTFFDDDVTAFFSPHSANKSAMFLIALGQPMKRSHA